MSPFTMLQDKNMPPESHKPLADVNILVVDDLPEKLMVYKTVLEELGHGLVTARSGQEALKLILKQEFAVILLDVNMPGMDGFETAALIRKRRKSAHTPIIFLTAFSDELKVIQGYASGAVDYLFTPVVPDILKAKVRVFVEIFQMRQQAALQAEERVRRLAAEESDRAKDKFLGMLAHELRNPLGPILNGMHLMQVIAPKEPRLDQLCQMVGRQVSHMGRLIDDLLDSTRLAQGKILLRKEDCCLAGIVRQTVEDYRSIFEEAGVELGLELPGGPVPVNGDATRLTQALGNLLHNARKFTNPGGKVSVRLRRDGPGHAQIIVEDDGIGIDAETLPFVFDVFRQAEQGLDRNKGGLGLGLCLVKGLVSLHGGAVTALSEGAGKGATIVIDLPLAPPAAGTKQENEDVAIPARQTSHRILLIEDNPDAAQSLDMLLTYEGHEIRTVHSGPEGLREARLFRPRIVLCDIGLPGMDGYEFMRAFRKMYSRQEVCAVALSGYGRDQDIRLSQQAGFNVHLTKPLDYARLRQIMSGLNEGGGA